MAAPNVDLVFVIDASQSMRPCFDQLRQHLAEVYAPMQGLVSKVRFGMVAQSVGSRGGVVMYDHQFLCGSGPEAMKKLYSKAPNDNDTQNEFFTDSPEKLKQALSVLKPQGNEDMLVALDIALDFPFGPLSNTKRVVALFSDEPFEGGISKSANNAKVPELIQKIQDRHIQLFCAIPDSTAIQMLAEVDRSEVELVDGGGGLSTVNFRQLLGQMGKSISGSLMQSVTEPAYKRAIFGQDAWGDARSVTAQNRDAALSVGEIAGIQVQASKLGVILDVSGSMIPYLDKLRKQIHQHFSMAVFKETDGCGLNLNPQSSIIEVGAVEGIFEELINDSRCDAIFWFCDLQDGGLSQRVYTKYSLETENLLRALKGGLTAAIEKLGRDLKKENCKLYIRSTDLGPERYPGLDLVVSKSGGSIRVGPPSELMT